MTHRDRESDVVERVMKAIYQFDICEPDERAARAAMSATLIAMMEFASNPAPAYARQAEWQKALIRAFALVHSIPLSPQEEGK